MRWRATPKLAVALVLVALGLVAGFATGRPEPIILVAPLAVVVAAALAMAGQLDLRLTSSIATDRAVEGDEVGVQIEVNVGAALGSVELAAVVPAGLAAPFEERTWGTAFAAGERRSFELRVRCERWGRYRLGGVWVRATSPLGLLVADGHVEAQAELAVHPGAETLRGLVRPKTPRAAVGNQLARHVEHGFEFADIRPFTPGDQTRSVNWRATARRGSLCVNQQHPDCSTDVVLLIDAFGEPTLAAAVRAASALARAYLDFRDRVGVVSFGGFIQWLRPGSGLRQEHLIVQALLETRVFTTEVEKDIDQIPPNMLPRNALVLALSPLQDERFQRAVLDLRARGVDVVTIEISPLPFVPPAPGAAGAMAYRLWGLQRDLRRDRLRAMGIPVVVWDEDEPLAVAVEEVAAWPRVTRSIG